MAGWTRKPQCSNMASLRGPGTEKGQAGRAFASKISHLAFLPCGHLYSFLCLQISFFPGSLANSRRKVVTRKHPSLQQPECSSPNTDFWSRDSDWASLGQEAIPDSIELEGRVVGCITQTQQLRVPTLDRVAIKKVHFALDRYPEGWGETRRSTNI